MFILNLQSNLSLWQYKTVNVDLRGHVYVHYEKFWTGNKFDESLKYRLITVLFVVYQAFIKIFIHNVVIFTLAGISCGVYFPVLKTGWIFFREVMTYLHVHVHVTSPSSIRLQAAASSCMHTANPGHGSPGRTLSAVTLGTTEKEMDGC